MFEHAHLCSFPSEKQSSDHGTGWRSVTVCRYVIRQDPAPQSGEKLPDAGKLLVAQGRGRGDAVEQFRLPS
ncbi:hypothetical protein [Nocardia cyriacigeorgica]|uniref:Uncharacterized protein n=1 Tax=Nocardia cyriacigeorgica TaxID=135487 RepID=A0A5R8NCX8_9NOCA|nr:hypothetical protein [Nocardia cyriacigeorgica]TLF73529.1 hypothetical protein FEK34_25830 [Nocardia cyriacigeorgica]